MMENLHHEVALLDSLTGIGIVAIDRVRNLTWKDYKPIAEGREVAKPHTGNVDTFQGEISSMMYNSQELPDTDLARLKNEPLYRAQLTASMTRTLAATMDCEVLDLLIAAAAGRKYATLEMKFPKYGGAQRGVIFSKFSYLGNEIEQMVNAYYIGINRDEISCAVSPDMYTKLIRDIPAGSVFEGQVLSGIQNNYLSPKKIAGITILRHPFLGIKVGKEATNDFQCNYDFTGIQAIISHTAAPGLHMTFRDMKSVINKDTFNLRLGQRIIGGKGLVYGDLIRVIKEPSSKDKPLPYEKALVEHRQVYNGNKYGFKDGGIEIPETIEELQKGSS